MQGWFHKRNVLVKLAYTDQASGIPPNNPPNQAFPPQDFQAGRINNPSSASRPRPVTYTVGSAEWIICALNIMGQQRYRYESYNGWCWDGASWRDIWSRTTYPQLFPNNAARPMQLSYFTCRIDFQGSPGPAKRDQVPLGYFGGHPVFSK
jgi:hypothetical protein